MSHTLSILVLMDPYRLSRKTLILREKREPVIIYLYLPDIESSTVCISVYKDRERVEYLEPSAALWQLCSDSGCGSLHAMDSFVVLAICVIPTMSMVCISTSQFQANLFCPLSSRKNLVLAV